jgi:ATP-dependent RNA helicase DDX27
VIATPGRILDLIRNSKGVHIDELEILIFDEADKLLELGFKGEVEELLQFANINFEKSNNSKSNQK